MRIITVSNLAPRQLPTGAITLWYGTASTIPTGFQIYAPAKGMLIMGAAAGAASPIQSGALTHTHENANTDTDIGHNHIMSVYLLSTSNTVNCDLSATDMVFYADEPNHTHRADTADGSLFASGSGIHFHTLPTTGSASNLPPYARLYYIQQIDQTIQDPVGMIVMSAVDPATLGVKWKWCDGTNGTPDLRGKFIYAASADGEVNTTGGASSHTHTNSSTGMGGEHRHDYLLWNPHLSGTTRKKSPQSGSEPISWTDHNHSGLGSTSTQANHNHSVGATVSANVLPPYRNLYYAMRVA